ncbi:MAG TPA: homocysteine S-methyltransferase family protein [Candidatus Acidoferrum sp.]|nr:homocysteine S-methyltransferase family protein [Candidatus Acidoferrum sp.]
MPKYREHLPQMDGGIFLTDGGMETTLIFHDKIELPHFAAFDLMMDGTGIEVLRKYYSAHASIASANGLGFILESPTWRANPEWGEKLGYGEGALGEVNRAAIALMQELREKYETLRSPMVISGCVGPRGDGYDPGQVMTEDEAETYHEEQIGCFRNSEADFVTGVTITNTPEAIGIVRAACRQGLPVVISFTVETDGRLPTGESLEGAIKAVDSATDSATAYYMINCAHPTHFAAVLATSEPWIKRLRGVRANASRLSHAELNEAPTLDEGNPRELGAQYAELLRRHPHINVLGGCCGTDHRHIEEIAKACAAPA